MMKCIANSIVLKEEMFAVTSRVYSTNNTVEWTILGTLVYNDYNIKDLPPYVKSIDIEMTSVPNYVMITLEEIVPDDLTTNRLIEKCPDVSEDNMEEFLLWRELH